MSAGWGAVAQLLHRQVWQSERKELEMVAWRSADWGPGVHFAPEGSGDAGPGEHAEHGEHTRHAGHTHHADEADTAGAGGPR